jgi:hypothetical protein
VDVLLLALNVFHQRRDERLQEVRERMREFAASLNRKKSEGEDAEDAEGFTGCGLLTVKKLNLIAHGCRKRYLGDFNRCLKFLTEMEKDGLRPDMRTFAILIAAVGNRSGEKKWDGDRGKAVEDCFKLWEMCEGEARRANEEWRSLMMEAKSETASLPPSSECANGVTDNIEEQPSELPTSHLQIQEYVQTGYPTAYLHSVIIEMCALIPDLERAQEYYNLACQRGYEFDPNVYRSLMDAYAADYRNSKVLEIFERWKVERGKPSLGMVSTIIITLSRMGGRERLEEVQRMVEEVRADGEVPSVFAINQAILGACREEDVDMALYLKGVLDAETRTANSTTTFSNAKNEIDASENAKLEEVPIPSQKVSDIITRKVRKSRNPLLPITTLHLLQLLRRKSQHDLAFQIFEDLRRRRAPRDIHWDIYAEMLEMYTEVKNWGRANDLRVLVANLGMLRQVRIAEAVQYYDEEVGRNAVEEE